MTTTYNHRITKDDDGVYRCTRCRRASHSQSILTTSVPCSPSPLTAADEPGSPDLAGWNVEYGIEPAFPDLGDVWSDPVTSTYYFWAKPIGDMEAPGWVDLGNGLFKPGQMSFSGAGINGYVEKYESKIVVAEETVRSYPRNSNFTERTTNDLWQSVLGKMLEDWAIPIGDAYGHTGKNTAIDAWEFSLMILARPIPRTINVPWHTFVRTLGMETPPPHIQKAPGNLRLY